MWWRELQGYDLNLESHWGQDHRCVEDNFLCRPAVGLPSRRRMERKRFQMLTYAWNSLPVISKVREIGAVL